MIYLTIWLIMGLIGVAMFIYSEAKSNPYDPMTLYVSTIIKIILLCLAGPLSIALYLYVWGDDLVVWRFKDKQ